MKFPVQQVLLQAGTLLSFFLLQVLLLWLVGQGALLAAILLHIGSLLLLSTVFPDHASPRNGLLLVMSAYAGVFGLLAAVLGWLLPARAKRDEQDFAGWLDQFLYKEKPNEHLYRRLVSGKEDSSDKSMLRPFQDIMLYGRPNQKRHVLGHLASHYAPGFAPVLALALKDGDNGVRVNAATILARLEQHYTRHLLTLGERRTAQPDNRQVMVEEAFACDDYAGCGMLDRQREKDMQRRAATLLEACHEHAAELPSAVVTDIQRRLARLLLALGEPDKVITLLQERMMGSDLLPASLMLLYWQALYEARRWPEMLVACESLRHMADPESISYRQAQETAAFWMQLPPQHCAGNL